MPILEIGGTGVKYEQEGNGTDLLLLHSLLTELSVFDGVIPELGRKHRIVRVNLPGFGQSSPLALDSVAAHADHIASVMAAFHLPKTTDVFGNGFGAFVALALAIRHGAHFNRLLVADTLAAFPEAARVPFRTMAGKVRAGGMMTVLDAAIGRMFPSEFSGGHPEVIAERKAALGGVDAECFARACLALAALDLSSELKAIRNPTLVLCGALDQTTPPALARELALRIDGAVYREIPDCGHCPMLEQPPRLVATMEAFLSQNK